MGKGHLPVPIDKPIPLSFAIARERTAPEIPLERVEKRDQSGNPNKKW
jgi:HAMP domain-containing protein